jgi:hypothetical protein
MNADRSERRAWLTQVAIGLGRALTRAEAAEVTDMWREYKWARKHNDDHFAMYPPELVKKFQAATGEAPCAR